jgi:hypothetical protein
MLKIPPRDHTYLHQVIEVPMDNEKTNSTFLELINAARIEELTDLAKKAITQEVSVYQWTSVPSHAT